VALASTISLPFLHRRVGVSPPLDDSPGLKIGLPRLNRQIHPAIMRMQVLDMAGEVRAMLLNHLVIHWSQST
jgi:hypothetical protein